MTRISLFQISPTQLLRLDLCGASLSAALLGFGLAHWESVFGLPARVCYLLAAFPVAFALVDLYGLRLPAGRRRKWLRVVAVCNFGYCLLSLALAVVHRGTLTGLGWGYVLGEVGLVAGLAFLEWRVAGGDS